jgi:hypothetical protein
MPGGEAGARFNELAASSKRHLPQIDLVRQSVTAVEIGAAGVRQSGHPSRQFLL